MTAKSWVRGAPSRAAAAQTAGMPGTTENVMPASAGEIRVCGRHLDDWSPSDLRREVAYVDQHIGLFGANIRENLTLWDDTMPEEQ